MSCEKLPFSYEMTAMAYETEKVSYERTVISYETEKVSYKTTANSYETMNVSYETIAISYEIEMISYHNPVASYKIAGYSDEVLDASHGEPGQRTLSTADRPPFCRDWLRPDDEGSGRVGRKFAVSFRSLAPFYKDFKYSTRSFFC
jgi:hypothetical protein